MKRLLFWLGIILLSLSWIFLIPVFMDSSYLIGVIIMIVGISAIVISTGYTNGVIFCGIVLLVQFAFLPFFTIIASHYHKIESLWILSWICNVLGFETATNNGVMYIQTYHVVLPFVHTLEKIGFFPWFFLVIGILIGLTYAEKQKDEIAKFIIAGFIYMLFRYIFLIFLYVYTDDISIFWNPYITILSFIPLIFVLPVTHVDFSFSITKKYVIGLICVFLFVFMLVGGIVLNTGAEKQGRILIDEYHSSWENTTEPMNETSFGMPSVYNYYDWAKWLDIYYNVSITNEVLTKDLLDRYDILILKCPTNNYSGEEVNDIIEFVHNGGGLLLIGDHTNVYGMNYYLNSISEQFGIIFNTDSVTEIDDYAISTFHPNSIHPVTQNINDFTFLTSCSLDAPLDSENIMVGNKLKSVKGSYSTEFFIRYDDITADIEYGLFLQCIGVKHGDGRVIAFTDSTVFSNFCLFMDEHTELSLGMMEYLNQTNEQTFILIIFAVFPLILLIYFFPKKQRWLFVVVAIMSFAIANNCFDYMNNIDIPDDVNDICFVSDYSDFIISSESIIKNDNPEKQFNTFFVATQRVGYIPDIRPLLEAMESDIIVIINPINFNVSLITEYIEKGGRAIILKENASTLNEKIGEGEIDVFNSVMFSDDRLGVVENKPDEEQLILFNYIFEILKKEERK